MHNPMNRNPEENRPLDPFAAAEAPEMASETTYPVEADGEIHELTLDELIEAAAQGLSKHNAYVRRNRAANTLPNGQIYAAFVEEYPDVRPEDIPQQVWEWAQQEGSRAGRPPAMCRRGMQLCSASRPGRRPQTSAIKTQVLPSRDGKPVIPAENSPPHSAIPCGGLFWK